jgi:hypothetical protein
MRLSWTRGMYPGNVPYLLDGAPAI